MRQEHEFTEICNLGKDVILSRMFQVMESFRIDGKIVSESADNDVGIHRIKAYSVTANSGKNVPQFIIQGNWVVQCGFKIGYSVHVECYPNKLVILKEWEYRRENKTCIIKGRY